MEKASTKTITLNRKARHDYFVEDSFEAGIELFGTEVKSLRKGACNLKDSWCDVVDGELYIKQMHISPYEQGNIFNKDPYRPRRPCSCTGGRSTGWPGLSRSRAIRSSRFPSISRDRA